MELVFDPPSDAAEVVQIKIGELLVAVNDRDRLHGRVPLIAPLTDVPNLEGLDKDGGVLF